MAQAMAAADPDASALYERNASALNAEVASTGIDFSNTLSTCPGTATVTPDGALSAMAGSYGLTNRVAGPDLTSEQISSIAKSLPTGGPAAAITEPWVDNRSVQAVAAAAGVKVRAFDTLAAPPAGGWPTGSTYLGLMEQNLATLSSALGCNLAEQ
jgi:ABC-type Zn uptake system ZnuABC Zn-binding protein ZnuA